MCACPATEQPQRAESISSQVFEKGLASGPQTATLNLISSQVFEKGLASGPKPQP